MVAHITNRNSYTQGLARLGKFRSRNLFGQAETACHTTSELRIALAEVLDHTLLNMFLALAQKINEVHDQDVSLSGLDTAVSLARLLVVVGASDLEAADRP